MTCPDFFGRWFEKFDDAYVALNISVSILLVCKTTEGIYFFGILSDAFWFNNFHPENNFEMNQHELATFGSGCFWCTEAFFQRLKGVEKVTSGYSGGKIKNPSYGVNKTTNNEKDN